MKIQATVLIVDDEAYVRESLATVLRRAGYKIRTADGSQAALQPGILEGLDAVITDLRMPGEDGLGLLRTLVEKEPGLPVILLTGHGSVPSAVECMRAGAYDYLMKPVRPEVVALLLERALSQSTMRRELDYLRSRGGRGSEARGPIGVSRGWRQVVEMLDADAREVGSLCVREDLLARLDLDHVWPSGWSGLMVRRWRGPQRRPLILNLWTLSSSLPR